jgi:transposase
MADRGGSSCRFRYHCAATLMQHSFAVWRGRAKTRLRLDGFWHLPRYMMARRAPRRPRLAGSAFRSSATGSCASTRGPDGLVDGKSPGHPPKLNDAQRQAVARMIESGPIPAVHGVVRWRLIDLAQWIFEEFRITIAKQTLSRELRSMGYRKLSARPRHHAQAAGAIENFKKASRNVWRRSRARKASTATR